MSDFSSLGIKYFLGDSFYINSGIANRKGYEIVSSDEDIGYKLSSRINRTGVYAALEIVGNGINFFLDMQWFSVFLPTVASANREERFQISFLLANMGVSL